VPCLNLGQRVKYDDGPRREREMNQYEMTGAEMEIGLTGLMELMDLTKLTEVMVSAEG
jgi:hypothetical protein